MPSSIFTLSPLQPYAHTSALAISLAGTAIGLRAAQAPASFAAAWGLPAESRSPWVLAMAGRNIAMGCVLGTFSYRGELKTFGTVLLCTIPTALMDAYVTWSYGDQSKVSGHLVPAVIMVGFGGWLVWGM